MYFFFYLSVHALLASSSDINSALLALFPAPEEVTRFSLDGKIMNLLPSDVVKNRLRVWLVHRQKNLLDLHLPSSI